MTIKTFSNLYNGENSYIITDENTKISAVIDPGFNEMSIFEYIKDNNLDLKYIILTHCHYDHISDIKEFKEKYNALIVCGKDCAENIKNPNINLSEMGLGYKISENADIILGDNEIFEVGKASLKCIYTPGHTSCSVCYLCEDKLFSGDTLFLRSIGRCDLPTGNEELIKNSLRNIIYKLHDETVVFPGHGDVTTVGYEKKFNLFVKE